MTIVLYCVNAFVVYQQSFYLCFFLPMFSSISLSISSTINPRCLRIVVSWCKTVASFVRFTSHQQNGCRASPRVSSTMARVALTDSWRFRETTLAPISLSVSSAWKVTLSYACYKRTAAHHRTASVCRWSGCHLLLLRPRAIKQNML